MLPHVFVHAGRWRKLADRAWIWAPRTGGKELWRRVWLTRLEPLLFTSDRHLLSRPLLERTDRGRGGRVQNDYKA